MIKRSQCFCPCHSGIDIVHFAPCCEPDEEIPMTEDNTEKMPPVRYIMRKHKNNPCVTAWDHSVDDDDIKYYSQSELDRRVAEAEERQQKLRGHLQNCVNLLHRLKRHGYAKDVMVADAAIDSANKVLYETLIGTKPDNAGGQE